MIPSVNLLKGLDLVISEARKYGIRLILSLVNNYDNFGGKKQYVDWARSKGENLNSDDDFFTNAVVKGYYKDHIKVGAAKHFIVIVFFYSHSLEKIFFFPKNSCVS